MTLCQNVANYIYIDSLKNKQKLGQLVVNFFFSLCE